jgi:Uma2 family endonuclease
MATDLHEQQDVRFVEPEGLYEMIGDQVLENPQVSAYEAWLSNQLHDLLSDFARTHRLGRSYHETLFEFRPTFNHRRRPDVAFVSDERWPIDRPAPRGDAAWSVIPDLAVEILSPTDLATEVFGKLEEYFKVGVRRVWLILPDQAKLYDYASPTLVQILTPADTLDGGDVLPGLRLDLVPLFPPTDAR